MTTNNLNLNDYFTVIKKGTRKADELIRNYNYSKTITLWEAYGRPSYAKEKAYDYCLNLKEKFNGYAGCITTFNTNIFTYGFLFHHPETDELYLAYITPSYNYCTRV